MLAPLKEVGSGSAFFGKPRHPILRSCSAFRALSWSIGYGEETSPSLDRFFSINGEALYLNFSVKTPEIVEAIAIIMELCLLLYNLAQRKLRQELAKCDDGIRNQVNKITNKLTIRWVFQMFQSIHLVIINGQKLCSNLTEER